MFPWLVKCNKSSWDTWKWGASSMAQTCTESCPWHGAVRYGGRWYIPEQRLAEKWQGNHPAVPALPQTSEPVILWMLQITCQFTPKLAKKQRLGERFTLPCIFPVSAKSSRNKTSFLTVVFPNHLEATDLRKKGLSPGTLNLISLPLHFPEDNPPVTLKGASSCTLQKQRLSTSGKVLVEEDSDIT